MNMICVYLHIYIPNRRVSLEDYMIGHRHQDLIDAEGFRVSSNDGLKRWWWDQTIKENAYQALWGETSCFHPTPVCIVYYLMFCVSSCSTLAISLHLSVDISPTYSQVLH